MQLRWVLALGLAVLGSRAALADDTGKVTETSPPKRAGEPRSAENLLADGRLEYERGDYDAAVHTLVPLLYPSVTLPSEDAVVEAHRLLALSYLLQKKEVEAEQEATSLFLLRPTFQLDPIVDPPMAVSFFENVRKQHADKIVELRERAKKDAAARAIEAERVKREHAERVYIERTVEHHSRLIATVPFGVGQLQNGQTTKAALFASGEILFGALSLGGYLALEQKYPVDPGTNKRYFPTGEENTARALIGLQLGAGIAFWATLAWGLIDAHVLFRREVVKTRELAQPPRGTKTSSSVTIKPGGLGLQGAF